MLYVKTYVGPSKIHGVGVFAAQNIKQHNIIYVDDKYIDVDAYNYSCLMKYSYVDKRTKIRTVNLDDARFMNHSYTPNTAWGETTGWAIRDIKDGEEITCNYCDFMTPESVEEMFNEEAFKRTRNKR